MNGQFTQEDPIGLAGGLNRYGYANGDPVNLSDPWGLCAQGDTIVTVVVDCGDGKNTGTREVEAVEVTDPAAAGDLIAIAASVGGTPDSGLENVFQAGYEATVNAALFGTLYVHPNFSADGLSVLTAGGAFPGSSSRLTFRADVWANIRARRPRAKAGSIQVCQVVAHEGGHLALTGQGIPGGRGGSAHHAIFGVGAPRGLGC